MKKQPSIFEHLKQFATEEKCIAHFERIRWPCGLRCIRCKGKRVFKFETEGKTGKERHLYECVDCRYQYSVTTGTIFHDSHLPLTKWFLAIYLICSAKKGVSAKQLQRELDTCYKTAWYMAHRIRLAMQEDPRFCRKFSGIVEAGETYVCGKGESPRGRSTARKFRVLRIRERTSGRIHMKAVEAVSATTIADFIREYVKPGAEFQTDEFPSYLWLDSSEFAHKSVNKTKSYNHCSVSTNGVENIWWLSKRGIIGVYHKIYAKYLPLYLHEFSFRFNNRDRFILMDRVLETSF